MAIAVQDDWAADGGGGSSVTVNFTAGTNLCAVVFVECTTTSTISGVTINSVSMTEIGSRIASGVFSTQMFVLPNPPTGSQTLVVSGAIAIVEISWISFTGVDQSFPVDNSNAGFAKAAAITATISNVVASNCWMVGMGGFNGGGITGVGDDFAVMFPTPTTDPASFRSSTTIGTGSQIGSYTTTGSSSSPLIFIAALQPPTGGAATATPSRGFSLLGVGQ